MMAGWSAIPSPCCSSWRRRRGGRWSTSAAARARSCAAYAAAGATAIGVETGAEPLARARAHEPVSDERYVEGVGQALPLEDASADAVLFVQSLHHVPEDAMDAALAEAARVARPGGGVVVLEPLAEGPFFALVAMVDDETRVRALAQEAVAARPAAGRARAALRRARPAGLVRRLPRPDHARRRRPRRRSSPTREDELRAAYDELAGPGRRARARQPVRRPPAPAARMIPPGPTEAPLLQTIRWLVRPIAFLESNRRRYGDAFSIMFLGFQTPLVIVSDPEVVRALYSERANGLPAGRTVSLQPLVGARSLLVTEGAEHLSRRRVMLPPFHGDRMRAYEAIVREATEREIAGWGRAPFPAHPRMQAITLEVILRAVFGVTDPERRERLSAALTGLLGSMSSPGLQLAVLAARRLGGPDPLARFDARRRDIDALLAAEIAARREAPGEDICSLLLAARFEDGAAMDDQEVRDQLMTLLLAGHETTATALAWTLDLLTRHPEAMARLRADEDGRYLKAVIAESLRLRPVVPLAGRKLAAPLRAGGLDLPAGTDVTPAIWLTHTRADLYPEPYAFRPERFLDRAPSTYSWIPFGGGIRRCIGAAFAEMEMRVVLRTLVERLDIRAAGRGAERVARRNVTFSPRRGTRIAVAPRSAGTRPPARLPDSPGTTGAPAPPPARPPAAAADRPA